MTKMSGIETVIMLQERGGEGSLELRPAPNLKLFIAFLLSKEKRKEMKEKIVGFAKKVAEKSVTARGKRLEAAVSGNFACRAYVCSRIKEINVPTRSS